jgi:hypothetical protein
VRLPALLALCALPAASAVVAAAACGGPTFTSASPDAGGVSSPAGDGAAGATGSFCALEAGTTTFCDDFDGLPLTSKWDSVDQAGSGAMALIDDAISDSPPGSFKSIAPASIGAQTRGRIVKAFGSGSRIVVAFELAIDATPARLGASVVGGDSLVGIDIGPSYSIGIAAHTDEVSYFEDSTGDSGVTQVLTSKDLVATPTLQGWTRVLIAIDLAHASLSISIGGVALLDGAPITPPGEQAISVYLGAFSHNQTQTLAAHFDNFTIDIAQ